MSSGTMAGAILFEAEMQQIEQGVMETSNDMEQFIIHTDTLKQSVYFTERNAMGRNRCAASYIPL